MDFHTSVRWTIVGSLSAGVLFGAGGVFRSLASGASPFDQWAPIGALALVGATVGMLLGPLVGGIVERRRERPRP